MKCINCGIEFEGRKDARYCSPKCRKEVSRKSTVVTDNVTLNHPDVTDNLVFKFKTSNKRSNSGFHEDADGEVIVREAKYWYDVPLAAVPVKQKAWPDMPDFINGRQYFLWWKNDFVTNNDPEKGELGQPVIHNPFPPLDNVQYVNAGQDSRRWGA